MRNFKISLFAFAAASALFASCSLSEDTPGALAAPKDAFNSLADFYSKNEVKSQPFQVDAANGGFFITPVGSTTVTIPAGCFVDQSGAPVTGGNVTIEFKDIYKKSDMLLSNMPTMTNAGAPLKSAGEFFIKVTDASGAVLNLASGKGIKITQPFNGVVADNGMMPFMWNGAVPPIGIADGWQATPVAVPTIVPTMVGTVIVNDSTFTAADTVVTNASNYVFSLYVFKNPADKGTWCNSDNSGYFSTFPQTIFTVNVTDTTVGNLDVFLVFKDIKSMVHVYRNGTNWPYDYAPQGLVCSVVAIGVKATDKSLYSAIQQNDTIKANGTVTIPKLSKTTAADFKTALQALD